MLINNYLVLRYHVTLLSRQVNLLLRNLTDYLPQQAATDVVVPHSPPT